MTDAATRAANVEAVRRYRERHPDLVAQSNRDATRRYATSERGRLARMMHARVRRAVRAGRLERLPCGVCGNAKSQGHHHRGYDFPLDVVWLCALHHKEAHRGV